jgi:uncharacterized protein YbdZ (MbtH family)
MTAMTQTYSVVTNDEGQYSTVPSYLDLPSGWRHCGIVGARSECLDTIEVLWCDLLPRSVRDQMKSADQHTVNSDMQNGSMFAIQRFQMFADRIPDRIAVVDADHEISYGALDVRSNRLAHYLIDLGVGPGSIACTHLPPGLSLMVSVLAIAKTGGAFLALDPQLPIARKRLMIGDCKPRVTIGSVDENGAQTAMPQESIWIGTPPQ